MDILRGPAAAPDTERRSAGHSGPLRPVTSTATLVEGGAYLGTPGDGAPGPFGGASVLVRVA
jgi:hypothetical protein